jgi:hypothetical protein
MQVGIKKDQQNHLRVYETFNYFNKSKILRPLLGRERRLKVPLIFESGEKKGIPRGKIRSYLYRALVLFVQKAGGTEGVVPADY